VVGGTNDNSAPLRTQQLGIEKMTKKQVKSKASTTVTADAPAQEFAVKVPAVRGPKGMDPAALIFVKAESNPKRAGSKAQAAFAAYRNGMTVQEYLDAVGAEATPNLVYDTNHGFIQVEGYTPAKPFTPKPKAEKAPKAPKAKRIVAEKTEAQAEVEAAVVEETIN